MTWRTRRVPGNAAKVSAGLALCCLLLIPALVSGCSSRLELDTSLLTDDPCAAPCWHNITPGVSDEDDVRAQLEDSPFVKEGTLDYTLTEQSGVPLVVLGWQARGGNPNTIELQDGKVSLIAIWLDYDLTLGEVVDKYGPPESVFAYVGGISRVDYNVTLDYPAQGLTFSVYHPLSPSDDLLLGDGTGAVSEDLRVTEVFYYAPTSLRESLSEVFLLPEDRVMYLLENSQEWQGFGPVKLAE